MHFTENNAIELPVPILRKHGIILLEVYWYYTANGVASSSPSSLISIHLALALFSRLEKFFQHRNVINTLFSDLLFVIVSSFLFYRRENACRDVDNFILSPIRRDDYFYNK